jgi:phospho-N-acetylmuramoyl-pentapeptide-transferase
MVKEEEFSKWHRLHHHFEMKGIPEPKIVVRFYIVAVILAIMALATFKIR